MEKGAMVMMMCDASYEWKIYYSPSRQYAQCSAPMTTQLLQCFDEVSCTFTYFLVDRARDQAVIIDSVDRHLDRDLATIERLGVRVAYVLETHAHADHITGAGLLRERLGALTGAPVGCGISPANVQLAHGDRLQFGDESVLALHTPGHTAGSMCFVWRHHLMTGDTLLINGCGRTDFQSGSAIDLYRSVQTHLFTLPDATLVWPGHDYKGNTISTIGWEKRHNARLAGRDEAAFVALMAALQLPPPQLMDIAVPANQRLGLPHAA
jgi:sulfur dioxygenase